MVTWRTPLRMLALLLIATGLGPACSSIDGPSSDVDTWKEDWKNRAVAVKDGAARGAEVVGDSLGTAYQGVRDGFEEPGTEAYGPYPKAYAEAIRRHMLRFEGIPDDASFQFGKPERGYMNDGILAGGKIEWQGWLVDVEVETETFAGQKRKKAYVVRMSDGEVVEVQDAAYAGVLRRVAPAAQAK
jgi:hypothetical protein